MGRPNRPGDGRVPAWQKLAGDGMALRKVGDRDGAMAAYRQAAAVPGAPAAVFFNLGNALFDAGRWADAEAQFARARQLDPGLGEAALQLARCAARQGRHAEAVEGFASALAATPDSFTGWLESGHALRQTGRLADAAAHYARAQAIAPTRWEPHLAAARVLEESDRGDEAARHYHRALPLAPGGGRAVHWHMARYRLERGALPSALEAMRQALLALPGEQPVPGPDERAQMQIDLAEILLRLGLTGEAHLACEQASAATEEATLVRLADTAFRHNLWQEAQQVLKRNVALHPDSAAAHWNLAHALAESWQMQEALAALERAEALAPQEGARTMRASIAGRMGDADAALAIYREMAQSEATPSHMASSAAMSALYSDTLDATAVAALHRGLFAPLGQGARSAASFANDRDPGRRLRLGLVSADFHHQHPVNLFMQPVLARLDRQAFATTLYFTGTTHDEQTRLARGRVGGWVECATLSDRQLAGRIEADGIDLLLDLSGHTMRNRMALFARRAAPVQATFLGYPGSTGVPNIDWIIADDVVAPEGHAALYSERVMRLPHAVFCFAPEAEHPFPAFGDGHLLRPLTFGSFNNVPKLTPRTLRLWAGVLAAVPESRLVLKAPSFKDPGAVDIFRQRLTALGVDPGRLEFRGPVGLADMMAEYADIDIALDPVPYNGGTTTMQALWMGAPVVALRGAGFVSRMGASFLTAAGLDDWIARDDRHYVEIAAARAGDRGHLLDLKHGLRQRLLSRPAWDIDRYVRDFERALRAMWEDHCRQ